MTDFEVQRHHKDGHLVEVSLNIAPMRDSSGAIVGGSMIARDISERKQHEARLVHQAMHDALTGLPNRTQFLTRLQAHLDRAAHDATYRFAVLFLDFDRFKYINDSMGHLLGDQMLTLAARRLQSSLSPEALIARLGGDEFAVVLENVRDTAGAIDVAQHLHASLTQPFLLQYQEILCTASIGIVLNTDGYRRPEEMLRDADTAMYEAKGRGRGRHVLFDTTMHARVTRSLRLEQELRQAIERQEFILYYQPIVALADGELLGFEALVRWDHPTMGVVSPREFITLAEETGMIGALDRWVMREACSQLRRWQEQFPAAARIAVNINVSARDLANEGFVVMVLATLAETGLAAAHVNLEITESVLIEQAHLAIPILTAIHAQGIGIYLDDFGTGFSSLSYLRELPIDALKIDQSFTRDAMQSHGRAILAGIVEIAHTLQFPVIVEGIEDRVLMDHLRSIGCDRGQGYFYARPLTVEQAEALLRQGTYALAAPRLVTT